MVGRERCEDGRTGQMMKCGWMLVCRGAASRALTRCATHAMDVRRLYLWQILNQGGVSRASRQSHRLNRRKEYWHCLAYEGKINT